MPVPRPTLAVSRAHVAIPAIVLTLIVVAVPAFAGGSPPDTRVSAASTGEPAIATLTPDLSTAIAKAEAERAAWFAGVAQAQAEREWYEAVARHQAELAAQQRAAEAAEAAEAERAAAPPMVATTASTGSVWDRLAQCESGGNWSIATGNGYYGGLQMDMQFWSSYGGPAFASRPDLASRAQQITVAERARDSGRGYYPWPTCARQLGLI